VRSPDASDESKTRRPNPPHPHPPEPNVLERCMWLTGAGDSLRHTRRRAGTGMTAEIVGRSVLRFITPDARGEVASRCGMLLRTGAHYAEMNIPIQTRRRRIR